MWSEGAQPQDEDEEGSEEEEEDSEEDSEDEAPKAGEPSREDRKKEKKARKDAAIAKAKKAAVQVGDLPSDSEEEEDDDDEDSGMPANPNHTKAARSQTKAPTRVDEAAEGVSKLKVSGTPSRRERESMEAQQAKERYRQMHEAGKTDEAKADLARLRLIREKRETEAARRQVSMHLVSISHPLQRIDHGVQFVGRERRGRRGSQGEETRDRGEGGQETGGCPGQARQEGGQEMMMPSHSIWASIVCVCVS